MPAISVFLLWKTNYSCGFFSNVALAKFRQTLRYNTFLIGRGNKKSCLPMNCTPKVLCLTFGVQFTKGQPFLFL